MVKGLKRPSRAQVASLALLHSATKSKGSEEPKPWCVIIPSLGVSMILVDENGDNVTGYIEKSKASAMVQSLCNELISDVEYLTAVRSNPQHVVLGGHFDKLGTIIPVAIYLPESFKV